MLRSALLGIVAGAFVIGPAAARVGYYMQPDVHGDHIVFVSESDLWRVAATGGSARRLTGYEGVESVPRFSPRGTRLAFTADYDGNSDVYVMDAEGGEPFRLTWHPGNDECVGWTPDGAYVLFRSRRTHPNRNHELFRVPVGGGEIERLPLGRGALIDIDPITGHVAFNRTASEYRTWKRYRGGTAQDIWVGPPAGPFHRITEFPGTDAFPMWHDGRLFCLSDEGGTANVWSMSADGTDRAPLTRETKWDLRWPSMGPGGAMVAMRAGDIVRIDVGSGAVTPVPIDLPSESIERRERTPSPAASVTGFSLSPDGDELLLVIRGELVLVPVDDDAGVTLPLTRTSGVRERRASFGPKGERVVYITDATGEDAVVVRALDDDEETVLRRERETGWLFHPAWAPSGDHIAYADETFRLYVADVKRNRTREIARSTAWEISEYAWSPDGRWLAYAMTEPNTYRSIFLYDTESNATHRVTSSSTDDFSPSFAPDGDALVFISNRNVRPTISYDTRDFNHMSLLQGRLYTCLLRDDVPHPFAPAWPGRGNEKEDEEEADEHEPASVEIDLDGLSERVVEVPAPPGNYRGLIAGSGAFYYFAAQIAGTRDPDAEPGGVVMMFDVEEREAKPFLTGVTGYTYVAACNKVAARFNDGRIVVVDGGEPTEDLAQSAVNLGNIVVEIDPSEEWAQKYRETWRNLRDFFWDENMGGVDWEAMRDQYASLLPRIGSPLELQDVMGELIGELGTSHTYIWGGDRGRGGRRRSVGLLGIDVTREGEAYRIDRIYRGDDPDRTPSPLLPPGVAVAEGDYILAVNGHALRADRPFLGNFQDLAGKPVSLTVNDRASMKGARHVVVTPLDSDRRLRYLDWVRRNREAVLAATGGRIGYLHLPDMDEQGIREFETWFYPQLYLEGMIIDTRYNGGGWVSQLILDRLRRRPLHFDTSRYARPEPYPFRVLNGPFVVLLNEEAGSDGDIFPLMVQREGLAPVIGTRSWGGVIGIRADKTLVDGTTVTHPEFSTWEPGQGWIIENYGVDPDIEVENLPHDEAAGRDAQLERGIAEVLRLHEQHPPITPTDTPKPDKSRGAFEKIER